LDPTRSAQVPVAYFGKTAKGILSVDRYVAYKVLLKEGRIVLAFCWAHVRRDFLGVAKDWGGQHEAWALGWVAKIGDLYQLNDQRVRVLDVPEEFATAQSRLREAVEQMAELRRLELADAKLIGARRKVLESLAKHWAGLIVFVDHPEVPMDSRVGDRRGGVQAALGCIRRFRLRARVGRAITPSPAPASSNRTGGFPASGSPRRRHHIGVMVPFGKAPAFAAS
jgi:transposase